jgi:hypothetical protein
MGRKRVRRAILGLILLITAFLQTETATNATVNQESRATQYADTNDCQGGPATGLILYLATSKDAQESSDVIVVANVEGQTLREILIPDVASLVRANRFGRAFASTSTGTWYLVDALSGTATKLNVHTNGPARSRNFADGVPQNRKWQLFNDERGRATLLVNLENGNVRDLTDWLGPEYFEGFWQAEITPDGTYIYILTAGNLIVGTVDDLSRLWVIHDDVFSDGIYYSSNGML